MREMDWLFIVLVAVFALLILLIIVFLIMLFTKEELKRQLKLKKVLAC